MKRLENESFKKYKERRKAETLRIKRYLKGRLVWIGRRIYGTELIQPPDFMWTYRRG